MTHEVTKIKDKLRAMYKEQGLGEDQIMIRMNTLDTSFLTHAFVNGTQGKLETAKSRLRFYIEWLEQQLE